MCVFREIKHRSNGKDFVDLIKPADVIALEEIHSGGCKLHLSSGAEFIYTSIDISTMCVFLFGEHGSPYRG